MSINDDGGGADGDGDGDDDDDDDLCLQNVSMSVKRVNLSVKITLG